MQSMLSNNINLVPLFEDYIFILHIYFMSRLINKLQNCVILLIFQI